MNEELKIIIKAVNDSAKKSIKEVRGELDKMGVSAKGSSGKLGAAMKGVAKGAAIAVAAIAAVGAAIVALGKKSLEVIKEQSKLIASFQAVGASAQQAETTYKGFYRFLGDKGKATEAAAHLAQIASNQEQLAEWTRISQGVFATFGDSLPIEGLTEAANETLRVGKVTGNLADALNWAGVSEDEFNAKLAQTSSYEEREALLRSTLNNLYGEAADIYEKNNKALLDYNESQAKVDSSLARTGAVITPLLTALNNLSAALLDALKPALDVIVPILTTVVNWLTQATQAVVGFFSALTGKSSSVSTAAKNIGAAANSAGGLGAGMGKVEDNALGAAAAIEEAKRAAMGFDELNIVPSDKGSGSGSGSGSSEPGYATNNGFNQEYSATVEEAEGTSSKFLESVKEVFAELATLFEPTKKAWTEAFDDLKESWNEAKPHFINGANEIKDGFLSLGSYLLKTFIPDVVNGFSTNLAPVIADISGFYLVELGKQFEWIGGVFNKTTNDILIPALDSVKMVAVDTFEIIGDAWSEHGETLMAEASEVLENLRGHFDLFYESTFKPVWDNIKSKFDEVWTNHLKPAFSEIVDSLMGIGEDLMILYNDFIAPVVNWIISFVAPYVVQAFNDIMDVLGILWEFVAEVMAGIMKVLEGVIGFITGVFTGDWDKAWTGIKDIFQGIWDIIVSIAETAWELIKKAFEPTIRFFTELWEGIQNIFSVVGTWFSNIFQAAWNGIQTAWSGVVSFFQSVWNGISNAFANAGNWFSNIFKQAWQGIQNAFSSAKSFFQNTWNSITNVFSGCANWFKDIFSKAWTNIKNVFNPVGDFFSGLWDKIKNKFSTLGTSIGNAISSSVKSGINSVIKLIENTINSAIGIINGAIGVINAIPGVNISKISKLSLPRLAKGGIAESATTAIIGEAGREAVLPLENNTEWMDKLADRIAARNNTPSKIVLQIGEKELGWATIGAINGITSQTGRLQLAL